jgi:thiol reductant ABC exporter CydC subunit
MIGQEGVLRRIAGLLRPERRRIDLALAAGTGCAWCAIGLATASGLLISRSALRPAVASILVLSGVVQVLALGRGGLRYLERIASHDAALACLGSIRVWFYERLEPLAPAALGTERSGDLLARFAGDVDALQSIVVRGLVPLVTGPLALLAGLALAWAMLPAAAALAALLGLGLVALVPLAAWRLEGTGEPELSAVRGRLAGETADLLEGAAEIVAAGAEDAWLARVAAAQAAVEEAERRAAWRYGIREALGLLFWGLGPVAMLVAGIPAVRSGRLPGTSLAALVLLGWATLEVLRAVPPAVDDLREGLRTASRLFAIADRRPVVADPAVPLPGPDFGPVDAQDLQVRYEPDRPPALSGVSFALPPGGRLAVVGPSGAGKTTLAQALLRFAAVDGGRLAIGGSDIAAYTQDGVRSLVGLLAQDTYLFDTTVGANVRLARPDATDGEVEAACRVAGLGPWLDTLPDGLATPVGQDADRVSGGERQRIALARALLGHRRILVLDEPTANLDAATGREVMANVWAATEGDTVVVITHDPELAWSVGTVLSLRDGRSVAGEPPAAQPF